MITGLRGLYPLPTYFILAYLISWAIWFPLYSPALGFTGLPVLPFHHGIGGLGPLVASLICTWIFNGKQGMYELIKSMVRFRPLLYVALALFSPFMLAILAVLISYILNGEPVHLSALLVSGDISGIGFAGFFFYNLLFFGFGEETGWRGFALPRLQKKYTAMTATIILTAFWAIWHWPLFLYRPGFAGMGIAGAIGWLFSLLTGGVLLTWFYNSSRASLLVCAIFHATVDIAFLADFTDQHIKSYLGGLITCWGMATVFVFKPKRLSSGHQKQN
ncbi:MAG: CPBP family intramembrane metalloprotease [Chitinophagaceae bacterium]|nr:CPBP family intramembrane metalloprotease [Chitinophagaceae bacterium]